MSREHPRLLITGFGPFPGMPVNPSGALARRIGALPRLRAMAGGTRVLVLRTAYDAIPEAFEPELARRPDAVLMIGVAARSTRVRVESRARNRASRLLPDASGAAAGRLALAAGGPAERRSIAAVPALAILRRRAIPSARSGDAGRYLCNAAYYRALAETCPVLFLHIPPLPRPDRPGKRRPRRQSPAEALAEAFAEVALALLARARTSA